MLHTFLVKLLIHTIIVLSGTLLPKSNQHRSCVPTVNITSRLVFVFISVSAVLLSHNEHFLNFLACEVIQWCIVFYFTDIEISHCVVLSYFIVLC